MNSRNVQTSSKDMPLRAKDHNKQSLRPLAFPLSLPFHLPTAPACNETIGTVVPTCPYITLHLQTVAQRWQIDLLKEPEAVPAQPFF